MTARRKTRRALAPRGVSGRCTVPEADLRKRLGKTAWAVLGRLWARRDDRTGLTFASDLRVAIDLASQRGKPAPIEPGGDVYRALKKLRASGLLVSPELGRGTYDGEDGGDGLGWQTIAPYGRVFVRQVLGELKPWEHEVMVPREVTAWMKQNTERRGGPRPNSGGARPGAGRPKTISKSGGDPPSGIQQKRRHILLSNNIGVSSSLRSEEGGAAHRPAVGPFGAQSPGTPNGTDTPDAGAADRLEAILNEAMGGRDGPRPRPVMLPDRVWTWPVRSAQRPLPPFMPPDVDGPLAIARFVAGVYAGAYQAATGKPYWPFVRGRSLPNHPTFAAMLGAGRTFHEENVRPARWVLWSFDCWRGDRNGAPPPQYVFSTTRLTEHWRWFRDEERGYAGRLDMMGPLEKALGARWLAMRKACLLRGPTETPEQIVERWFPGDTWERAVQDAQAEASRMQADLDRRAAAGEWLWGA